MPRKARIDAPGALHHIMVRGIERKLIFFDVNDRNNFVDRLCEIIIDTETFCFAWALMPNHVHLLLRTGQTSISTVMRRLLTGYAVSFNLRHRRHGQLFQNRYKSILCQEEAYLRELVRYIHLNALRKKIVGDLKELDEYPFSGHSALMNQWQRDFQDTDYVLGLFGDKVSVARKGYRAYLAKGIALGRRPDLVGGGLIRSAGGWSEVKAMRRSHSRMKGDERILGDGEFVQSVLDATKEQYEERCRLKTLGYDLDTVVKKVAIHLGIAPEQVCAPGKHHLTVKARSLMCYWAVRELGLTTTEVSRRIGISQPAVSISVKRGEKISAVEKFKLM